MSNARNLANLLNTDTTIATGDVADGGITTAKLADDAVTSAKLDTNIAIGGTLGVTGETTLTGALTVNDPIQILNGSNVNSASTDADDLIIEGPNDCGLSILSATTGRIFFGDASDNDVGSIRYIHTDNSMRFETNAGERMRIDSSGNVGLKTTTPSDMYYNDLVVNSGDEGGITILDTSSGQTSLAFADGTSGNARYRGRVLYDHSDDSMFFGTAGDERMRIVTSDSRSVLSIGDSTVYTGIISTAATNSSLISMNSGGGSEIVLSHHDALSTSGLGSLAFNRGTANLATIDSACDGATDSASLKFRTTSSGGSITERIRVHSNGTVSVGSSNSTGGDQFKIHNTGSGFILNLANDSQSNGCLITAQSGTGTVTHHQINNSNGLVGKIVSSGSGTSYVTSSDYRLKENVTYEFDATSRLKQLKPCRFNFKADANTTVDGFLAHEVTVVPEAISGDKDAVDADGNVDPQGIDQSKLVPLLVKTIQELEARITVLESA